MLTSFQLHCLTPFVIARGNAHRQRRRLAPNESIHRHLQEENEAGNMRPRFTLVSAMKLDDEEDASASAAGHYDIDVIQATSAVTASTTYSEYGGPHYPIGDLGVKYLFQDRSSVEDVENEDGIAHIIDAKPTTFAIIAVDEDTKTASGIAKKQGENAMSIQQMSGFNLNAIAKPADDFVPPKDFSCQTTHEHDHKRERARGRRILEDESLLIEDEHHIEQHDHTHDHDRDHNHLHNHDHIFSGEDVMDNLINEISHHKQLHSDGIPKSNYIPHRTGFSDTPSNQVDLYIEIDQTLIRANGNNLTKAFQYVNTIVSASSAIYEAEVDTRLTVAHIEVTGKNDT